MRERDWRKFDIYIPITIFLMLMVSCTEIYFSTKNIFGTTYLTRQIIWGVVGFLLFFIILFFDHYYLNQTIYILYGAGILILIFVLIFGIEKHGAKSWLQIGSLSFQPSEIVKVIVILTLAKYFSEINTRYLTISNILISGFILFLPISLIILQRDLGTALTLIPVYLAFLILGGLRKKIVILSIILGIIVGVGSWNFLKDYQKKRILAIFNPEMDPSGINYQTIQSVIAIGSGGLTGKGLGKGSQGSMGFLPEKHTDFIFSIISEELGFIGGVGVLLLYFFLFYRSLIDLFDTSDLFRIYSTTGIVTLYMFHLFVNVGMAIGFLPVIGIPLAPISYGGSSVISFLTSFGIVENFRIYRFLV